MGDTPEKEQDTGSTHQGTHVIYHFGYSGSIWSKLWEQIGCQHEERGAGRMSDLQFIAGSNELGTIPETGCRFYCHAIDRGSNNESKPTD